MTKSKHVAAVSPDMRLTPERVADEYEWVRDRGDVVVPLLTEVRADLGDLFDTEVDPVTEATYRREVDAVFTDGEVTAGSDAADARFVRDEVIRTGNVDVRKLGRLRLRNADILDE